MAIASRRPDPAGLAPAGDRSPRPVWREIRRAGFHLGGIASPADAARVTLRVRCAAGVLDVVVSPVTEIAYVAWDADRTDAGAVQRALEATGHGPATPWRP